MDLLLIFLRQLLVKVSKKVSKQRFFFIRKKDTMLTWNTCKNVNSGHDIYFDLFGWVEIGQILQPFLDCFGHFGTSHFRPLWSLKDYHVASSIKGLQLTSGRPLSNFARYPGCIYKMQRLQWNIDRLLTNWSLIELAPVSEKKHWFQLDMLISMLMYVDQYAVQRFETVLKRFVNAFKLSLSLRYALR